MSLFEQLQIQKNKKSDTVFNTETMLRISEIQDDTIILKDGWLRAIIKVEGINLDLRNNDESLIVLEQYKRFINGLEFPIQILIRNTYLDLTQYIDYMHQRIAAIANPTLKTQGDAYVNFMENISLQQWLIFVKEFYVIVPYYSNGNDSGEINKPRWQKMLNILEAKEGAEKIVQRYRNFVKQRKFLDLRVNIVTDGLRAIGLGAERIDMNRIVTLLFSHYNPAIHQSEAEMA